MAKASHRRRMDWGKVQNIRSILVVWVATASGAGLSPVMPGTMGSLVGMPIAYAMQRADGAGRLLFWLLIFGIGTWSAQAFDRLMKTQDHSSIVVDEVVGMAISSWTAGVNPKTWFVSFLAFRFFDILKPWPIRKVDAWSKKQSSAWWGGFGVMFDDVLAGIEALVVVILLQKLGFLL